MSVSVWCVCLFVCVIPFKATAFLNVIYFDDMNSPGTCLLYQWSVRRGQSRTDGQKPLTAEAATISRTSEGNSGSLLSLYSHGGRGGAPLEFVLGSSWVGHSCHGQRS